MADNPIDPRALLTAARGGGAHHYIAAADQLAAAGHAIPYAHRRDVEQVRAAVAQSRTGQPPHGPSEEAILRGGLSAADARSAALANRLVNAGIDRKRVVEAMGDPAEDWEDNRTSAQSEHDRRHGITPVINPNSYYAPIPGAGEELSPADRAMDTEARGLASDLGLSPSTGSNLIRTMYAAGDELARTTDPAALRQRWDTSLQAIYPGDKLAEAERQVADLLKTYGSADNKLVARLRETGLLRNPLVFRSLHTRAMSIAAWSRNRPE